MRRRQSERQDGYSVIQRSMTKPCGRSPRSSYLRKVDNTGNGAHSLINNDVDPHLSRNIARNMLQNGHEVLGNLSVVLESETFLRHLGNILRCPLDRELYGDWMKTDRPKRVQAVLKLEIQENRLLIFSVYRDREKFRFYPPAKS